MTTLLLVDDDPVQRNAMLAAIDAVSPAGVVVKGDGDQALQYLEQFSLGTAGAPAVIFLDLSMPSVSGFEVLRKLRSQADMCRIPVVVFTQSEREVDVYLGYHLGANAYVVKPRDPVDLRRTVSHAASFWLNTNVRAPRC